MLNRLLLISMLFPIFACSEVTVDEENASAIEKIVNGELENNQESTVQIQLNGNHLCTGTLIKKNVVLTAAHCIAVVDNGQTLNFGELGEVSIHIVVNQNIIESANVTSVLMYPQWNGQNFEEGVDVGLIYLDRDLTPNPIPLDNVDPINRVGSMVKVVGYGLTDGSNNNSNPNAEKRSVDLKIIGLEANGTLLSLDSADQVIRNSCRGDSGGPVFSMTPQGQVVSGITSFGDEECVRTNYNTSVFHKLDWIQQNLNGPVNGNQILGGGNNANPNDPNQGFPNDPNQGFPNDPNQGFPNDPNQGQGNLDCASVAQCLSACQDEDCANDCFAQASAQAINLLSAVENCANQNQCQDNQCVNQACQAEINACLNGDGGNPNDPNQGFPNDPNQGFPNDPNQGFPNDPNQVGLLGCLDLDDCLSTCIDQQCAQECFDMADPNAVQTLEAIYICIDQSQCHDDEACIEDTCAAEIQACF